MRSRATASLPDQRSDETAVHGGGPALAVQGLSVAFGGHWALSDVTFELAGGTFAGVLGPNGAGKTTLLRALLGVLPATGQAVLRGRTAYVPQLSAVTEGFPIDARGVVLMGRYPRLGWRHRPGRADRRLADDLLTRIGLGDRARSPFDALSGGQRQRVLVARALAQDADLLLLDEPLTGTDAPSQDAILGVIAEQCAEGRTVLMTTHDLAQAARDCDRLLLLNRTLVADGPRDAVLRPEVLRRAYQAEILTLGGQVVLMDEGAHHPPAR